MYFRNISPSTTCLYSAASMFFLSLSADFQSCFSNGSSVPFPFFFAIYFKFFLSVSHFILSVRALATKQALLVFQRWHCVSAKTKCACLCVGFLCMPHNVLFTQ